MSLGLPLAFAQFLNTGAVDQQVQAGRGRHDYDSDVRCLLPAAHRAAVMIGPVEAGQLQQGVRHAHGLV